MAFEEALDFGAVVGVNCFQFLCEMLLFGNSLADRLLQVRYFFLPFFECDLKFFPLRFMLHLEDLQLSFGVFDFDGRQFLL